MRLGLDRQFAGRDDLFVAEIAGLDDDFHPPIVGRLDDIADFADDVAVIAVDEPSEVHHHVDLIGAVVHGGLGFVTL